MIENPYPENWKDLQSGVCRLFRDLGLNAVTEKIIETPRGKVEIDVFAIDEKSVDKIKYLVECKNWETAIPQSVVLSFTSVMQEVGANIGFIVSRKGLQKGALAYTKNTNILGLTFAEFQARYFDTWYERYFINEIDKCSDALKQYVEPCNSHRERFVDNLSIKEKSQFQRLWKKYHLFGMFMTFFVFKVSSPKLIIPSGGDIELLKRSFQDNLGNEYVYSSIYYRDLLAEILEKVNNVTAQFNAIFGKDIFAE